MEPFFPITSEDCEFLGTIGSLNDAIEVDDSELTRAWQLLQEDTKLRHAVGAHHQGLRMMDEHQSYAAIAFISVLETLGDQVPGSERCNTCSQLTGLASKFRRAVSEAFGDAAVATLDTMYDRRSKTAHEGMLHGLEYHPESYSGRYLTEDRESDFYRRLHLLRAASTQLLRVKLGITCGAPL